MWWRTYRRLRASSEELWMACLLGGSDGTRLIGTNIYATALACARPPSTPPGRRRRAWKSRTPANRSSRPRRGTPRPRPSALAFSAPSGRWCDDVGNCAKSAVRHLQPPPFRVTFCNVAGASAAETQYNQRCRVPQDGPGGPPAAVEEISLVRSEAQRESHLSVGVSSARPAPQQPPDRACLSPFSSSGNTTRPPGPAGPWISGAITRCDPASSR